MTPLLLLLVSGQSKIALPPYVRETTLVLAPAAYERVYAVQGEMGFFAGVGSIDAVHLPTLKRSWSAKLKESAGDGIAVGDGKVFVHYEAQVAAFDAKSGKLLWTRTSSRRDSGIAYSKGILYYASAPKQLAAFNTTTRKIQWTSKLGVKEKDFPNLETLTRIDSTLLVRWGTEMFALDAQSGKLRWRQEATYHFGEAEAVNGQTVWLGLNEGSVARHVNTGKELWKSKQSPSEAAISVGSNFVVIDNGHVMGVSASQGKVQWKSRVGPDDTTGGGTYLTKVGNLIFASGISNGVVLDLNGKELWRTADEAMFAPPVYADKLGIITYDNGRLLRYVAQAPPSAGSTPEQRRATAERLVKQWDLLDRADKLRVEKMGDDAFEALVKGFLSALKKDPDDAYSLLYDIGQSASRTMSPSRTSDVIDYLKQPGLHEYARSLFVQMLATHGTPSETVPVFIDALKNSSKEKDEWLGFAPIVRNYLVRSADPRAVSYVLSVLEDPNGEKGLKELAYTHLAGSGDPKALAAVLRLRRQRSLLPDIESRFNAGLKEQAKPTISKHAGAQGKTLGLIELGILGSHGDLWLAELDGDRWVRPKFLGVSSQGVSRWVQPKEDEPKFEGRTASEIAKASWWEFLPVSALLARDTDSDGLTDLMERRLGTDVAKADTDGDGDLDAVDPWPNVLRRPESDAEQLLAAAFEARFHDDDLAYAGLLSAPKGVRAFEMPGRPGVTVWLEEDEKRDWVHPLSKCYEQGVAFIRFGDDSRKAGAWEDRVIEWNHDKTMGTVSISVYYGGLNGSTYGIRVKKIDQHWVVVAMVLESVS